MSSGYVYVLKNRAFPSLVKIGHTKKNPEERAAELSGTGNPHPFKVAYSVHVKDCKAVEQQVHEHLADRRLKKTREFFQVSIDEAKVAVDLFAEYTPDAWDRCATEPKPKRAKAKPKRRHADAMAKYTASIDDRTKGPEWPKNPNLRGDVPRGSPITPLGWMNEERRLRYARENAIENDRRIYRKLRGE